MARRLEIFASEIIGQWLIKLYIFYIVENSPFVVYKVFIFIHFYMDLFWGWRYGKSIL